MVCYVYILVYWVLINDRLYYIIFKFFGVKLVVVVVGGFMGGMIVFEYLFNIFFGFVRVIIFFVILVCYLVWCIFWGEV